MSREDNLAVTEQQLQQYEAQTAALHQDVAAQLAPTTTKAAPAAPAPTSTGTKTSAATGPFSGVGVFTAHNALDAMKLQGKVDWVAIRPDQTSPAEAQMLRNAGFKIVLWQDVATPNAQALVNQYGASGYIAQAEVPSEYAAAVANAGSLSVPKALIGNPNDYNQNYPPGWIAMPEAYTNANPSATPDQVVRDAKGRGATTVIPVLGTWGSANGTVTSYLPSVQASGSSAVGLYLAEQMTDADIAALPQLRSTLSGTSGAGYEAGTLSTPGTALPYNPDPTHPASSTVPQPNLNPGTGVGPTTGVPTKKDKKKGVPPPALPPTENLPYAPGAAPGAPGSPTTTPGAGGELQHVPPDASGSGAVTGAPSGVDYSGFLGFFGIPSDVQNQVNAIFSKYADPQQAIPIALAYIRGTPWYQLAYPGINEGISRGMFTDERGYRDYVNQIDVLEQRYHGGNATSSQITDSIARGINPQIYGQQLEGQAWANVNQKDVQAVTGAFGEFGRATPEEVVTLGNQRAGLSTEAGLALQARLDKAAQRMQTIFQGTLASPRFDLLSGGRPVATTMGGKAVQPGVGSIDVAR